MPTQALVIDGEVNRATVTALIFNHAGEVLVGSTLRHKDGDYFQLPQGGMKIGEKPLKAIFREVSEELGFAPRCLTPLVASTEYPFYRFPKQDPLDNYHGIRLGVQAFLLRKGIEWKLDTWTNGEPPEFKEAKWIKLKDLAKEAPPHKKEVYDTIAAYFDPLAEGIPLLTGGLVINGDRKLGSRLRSFFLGTARNMEQKFSPILLEFPGVYLPYAAQAPFLMI